jgi:hypothetical protein
MGDGKVRVAVRERLFRMGIGSTAVISDRVVTRWGIDAFEVDTHGLTTISTDGTVHAIARDWEAT